MFSSNRFRDLLIVALGTAGSCVASHADLQYTQEMRMGKVDPKAPPMVTTTRSSRRDALREETVTQFGAFKMRNVHLTLCHEKKIYEIDPALKIYDVASLDEPSVPASPSGAAPANNSAPAPDNTPSGTGKMIMTISVQDLGEDMVADRKAHHSMNIMHMQNSGCAGNSDTTMKMEIWTSPGIKEEFHCSSFAGPNIPTGRPSLGRPSKCKMSMETHGDTGAMSPYNGIQMREIMYQGDTDKVMMEMQITSLSTDKLDDSVFSVPGDYKEVTSDEFHKQQSNAMMQQMMGGHAPSSNDAGADNGNANAGNANAGNGDAGNGDTPPPKKSKPKFPFNIPGF